MTTLLIALPIAVGIYNIRHGFPSLLGAWREARWYERIGLCLLIVPIPGPVDEIVALLVMRRVLRRRSSCA